MRVEVGQYALIQKDPTKKPILGLVTKLMGRKIEFEVEKKKPEEVTDEADLACVVAVYDETAVSNYDNPTCLIQPYYKSFTHETGNVHFFLKCNKKVKDRVEKAIDTCVKRLQKHKIGGFLPVEYHIRQHTGQKHGSYKPSKDPDKKPDIVTVHLSSGFVENGGLEEYVFMHEFGHGVWFRVFTRKQRAMWINLFREKSESIQVKEATLKAMRHAIEKGRIPLQELMRNLKEEAAESDSDKLELLKLTMKYIKETYHINVDELNELIDDGKSLEKYWPTAGVILPKFNIGPTEYSKTNPKEFFAESFAHYMISDMRGDIPDYALKMLQKTL